MENIKDSFHAEAMLGLNKIVDRFKKWFYSILCMTCKTYERILASTDHPADCIAVYMHLLWTSRKQKTNTVYANNIYIQKGLKIGDKKVKHAKTELHRIGLIEYKKDIDTKTKKILASYTVVKFIPSMKKAIGTFSTPVETHPCGKDEQMLVGNKEVLEERKKAKPADAGADLNSPQMIKAMNDWIASTHGAYEFIDYPLKGQELGLSRVMAQKIKRPDLVADVCERLHSIGALNKGFITKLAAAKTDEVLKEIHADAELDLCLMNQT